jgi:hypothetical protein
MEKSRKNVDSEVLLGEPVISRPETEKPLHQTSSSPTFLFLSSLSLSLFT